LIVNDYAGQRENEKMAVNPVFKGKYPKREEKVISGSG
jgi:hypothetical protein